MTNPTSNYGFVLPTATDLVTDLPADFDVALQGVDTRLKALNPETTLGDLAYASATANTNTRLGIGTSGQVLAVVGGVPAWSTTADQTPLTTKGDVFTFTTVDARLGVGANGTVLTADSAEATGLKWAAPTDQTPLTTKGDLFTFTTVDARLGVGANDTVLTADSTAGTGLKWAAPVAAGANWSLLSSTALSGSTTTITGISGKDKIMILVDQASGNTGGESVGIRVNTDTAANYNYFGQRAVAGSTYSNGNYTGTGAGSDNNMAMFNMGSSAGSVGFGSCMITGCNAAGIKIFQTVGGANGTNAGAYATGGYYTGSSVISSVSVFMSGGSFDAGTVRVYTSA